MLESFDLFGKKVEFKFNGRGAHKSIIGGLSTLILVIIFVLALMYFGRDIILRRAPKTIMSNLVTESPEEVLISPSTFNFAFGLQNPANFIPFMDESIYTAQVTYNRVKKEVQSDGSIKAIITQVSLETEKCTTQHFGDASSQFSKLQLNQLYCLKDNQANLNSLTIQGDPDSSIYEFINVDLFECDDQDTSMSCASKLSRDELLKNGVFNLYFTNRAIDLKNYEQPNLSYKDSYFTKTSYNITKEIEMWIGHIDIITDSGWIVENKKNQSLTKYSRVQELLSFNGDSNQLVNLVIQSESIRTQYERTYVKIQTIMAAVDGIIPMGLIAIFIFVSPYSRIKFYETLINELFEIKEFDPNKKVAKRKRTNARKKKEDLVVKTKNPLEKKKKLSEPPKVEVASPSYPIVNQTGVEKLSEPVATRVDLLPEFFNQANVVSTGDVDLERGSFLNSPQRQMDLASSQLPIKRFISDIQQDSLKQSQHISLASPLHAAANPMLNLDFASKDHTEAASSQNDLSEKPSKMHLKLLDGFENKNKKSFHWILQRLISQRKERLPEQDDLSPSTVNMSPKDKGSKTFKIFQLEPPALPENRSQEKKPSIILPRSQNQLHEKAESFKRTMANIRGQSYHKKKRVNKINITFWDYIKSFIWKSKSLNQKLVLIQEGMARINERLDIFNVLRKLREVDKLKVLLFEGEQLVLFEGLPRPELRIKEETVSMRSRKSITHDQLKNSKFITEIDKNELIALSYESLKNKNSSNIVDQKLIEIYEDMFD